MEVQEMSMTAKSTNRPALLSVITATALFASGTALAQTSSTPSAMPPSTAQQHASGTQQTGSQPSAAAQKQLRQQLQQAGFQNVDILAAGYVLRAVSPSGDLVTVSANPESIAGKPPTGNAGGGPSATQSKLRQALEQAGFHNVQVVDRAYVAQAQAPDGNTVVMAVNLPAGSAQGSGSSMPRTGSAGAPSATTPSGNTGTSSTTPGATGGTNR
jgi:hypothetical protein